MKLNMPRVPYHMIYVLCSFFTMMLFFTWNYSLLNYNSFLYYKCLITASSSSPPLHSQQQSLQQSSYHPSLSLTFPSLSTQNLDECINFVQPKLICKYKRLDFYEKEIDIILIGANIGEILRLFFTHIDVSAKYVINDTNHDYYLKYNNSHIYIFMIITTIIQLITSFGKYYNYFQYTCIDFLSVESLPYIWIEWISTIPLMLFLVNTINIHLSIYVKSNPYIEIFGGLGIFCLFLGNFLSLPFYLHMLFFILSHITMFLSLFWLCKQSYNTYQITYKSMIDIMPANRRYDIINKVIMDDYKIANRKLNCTVNVIIAFLLFPIMYYIRLFNIINREYYIISLLMIGFVTKRLCIQSNLNIHFNIIDQPLKKEIMDNNKVKAESKLLFLKYVFHAIRVPLNSIALGLQVLKESSKFSNEDNDILSSMKDGKSDDIFNDDNL